MIVCFRRENDISLNEKEIIDRWDICIASMQKMTKIFMRMRENLGKVIFLEHESSESLRSLRILSWNETILGR